MTLLNSFIVFNESKNIVEAANRLGITQPALSKQLREFESGLKVPVFTTQGRKKVLTPFGRMLHQQLLKRLGNVHKVIEDTQVRYQSVDHAKLNIVGRRGILDRISQKLNFKGSLFFIESSNEQIVESLQNLKAEVGITHIVPDSHELMAKPLFKEEFHLLIPKVLFSGKPILGENLFLKLKELPCLGYKPDDQIIHSVCSFYSLSALDLKIVRATENYNSIKEMVTANIGWAIIPSYLKVPAKDTWVIPIPNKVLVSRQFFLIWRAEFSSVPWFKELISEIQSCFH